MPSQSVGRIDRGFEIGPSHSERISDPRADSKKHKLVEEFTIFDDGRNNTLSAKRSCPSPNVNPGSDSKSNQENIHPANEAPAVHYVVGNGHTDLNSTQRGNRLPLSVLRTDISNDSSGEDECKTKESSDSDVFEVAEFPPQRDLVFSFLEEHAIKDIHKYFFHSHKMTFKEQTSHLDLLAQLWSTGEVVYRERLGNDWESVSEAFLFWIKEETLRARIHYNLDMPSRLKFQFELCGHELFILTKCRDIARNYDNLVCLALGAIVSGDESADLFKAIFETLKQSRKLSGKADGAYTTPHQSLFGYTYPDSAT